MTNLKAIVYETPRAWVESKGLGLYVVWKIGVTHSTKSGTYHFPKDDAFALARAKDRCDQI